MDNNLLSKKNRRAVAPIIATLILVAIAVVGGVMIFVFAQDFFGGESMTGPGTIDIISLAGYDLTNVDNANIAAHDGTGVLCADCIAAGNSLAVTDIGAIYIKNSGGADVIIRSIEIAGTSYTADAGGVDTILAGFLTQEFTVYNEDLAGGVSVSTSSSIAGQDTGTIFFRAFEEINNGRTVGVVVTTGSGQEFNFNVVVGQTS